MKSRSMKENQLRLAGCLTGSLTREVAFVAETVGDTWQILFHLLFLDPQEDSIPILP